MLLPQRKRGPTVAQHCLFCGDGLLAKVLSYQPQFRRPVRQSQAQSLQVRMAGSKLRFHARDLPAAASDSCGRLPAFLADLLEGSPVALECGLLP